MENRRLILILLCFTLFNMPVHAQDKPADNSPLRLAVAGISHDHVGWILRRKKPDVILVGIYEPDSELAQRYAKRYNIDPAIIYSDLDKMLDAVRPEVTSAFGPVNEHLAVVEACAPRGINVMVEKPLATSLQQALRMDALDKKIQNTTAHKF